MENHGANGSENSSRDVQIDIVFARLARALQLHHEQVKRIDKLERDLHLVAALCLVILIGTVVGVIGYLLLL